VSKNPFLRIFLTSKVFVVLLLIMGANLSFDAEYAQSRLQWGDVNQFETHLATWDSAYYLAISQDGYQVDFSSCAFYPLWPSAIHMLGLLHFAGPLFCALIAANVLSIPALWLFYTYVKMRHGPSVASDSLILLLAFPAALFFSVPYTESLYFLLLMLFFFGLETRRYFWVGLACLLMPMTKAIGVFIALPLAWHFLERKAESKRWLLLLAPFAGFAAYFAVMWLYTGNAFEGFKAQQQYPNSPSIANMFNIAGLARAFVNAYSYDGMLDSILDRALFVVVLCSLPILWLRNKTWFFFVGTAGVIPALSSWFISYRRYSLILFPLFVVGSQLFRSIQYRWVFWCYVAIMALMQAWAAIRFARFQWAG